jgi:thioesterase domain-containing protein
MAGTAAAVQALKLSQQQDQQVADLVAEMVETISQVQEAGKGELIDLAA